MGLVSSPNPPTHMIKQNLVCLQEKEEIVFLIFWLQLDYIFDNENTIFIVFDVLVLPPPWYVPRPKKS